MSIVLCCTYFVYIKQTGRKFCSVWKQKKVEKIPP